VKKPLIERGFLIKMGHRSNHDWMLFLTSPMAFVFSRYVIQKALIKTMLKSMYIKFLIQIVVVASYKVCLISTKAHRNVSCSGYIMARHYCQAL